MVKNKLGKGLSALITSNEVDYKSLTGSQNANKKQLSLASIEANIDQPRKNFSEAELTELADSIKEKGLISPIIVRPLADNKYQIIAGERRWRACKLAGLEKVDVIIKNANDQEVLELALIENIQRQDLTPLEEAEAYSKLIQQFSYTHEQLAHIVSKSRSHISNFLRLLNLPDNVKSLINSGQLTMGHARSLLGLEDNIEQVANEIIANGLNVRQAEALVNSQKPKSISSGKKSARNNNASSELEQIAETLSSKLGMKIRIEGSETGGTINIEFNNLNQLDAVLQKLTSKSNLL